jgi:hypothetical protein
LVARVARVAVVPAFMAMAPVLLVPVVPVGFLVLLILAEAEALGRLLIVLIHHLQTVALADLASLSYVTHKI